VAVTAGVTWSAVTFAAGTLDSATARATCAQSNFTGCRVGNPAAVWDSASAEVVLAYVVRGFGAGEDPIGNGVSRSADGKTWGMPTDVSAGFAGAESPHAGMPGPGTALQLDSGPKKGRLLVPSHHGAYEYDTVTVSGTTPRWGKPIMPTYYTALFLSALSPSMWCPCRRRKDVADDRADLPQDG
jgi:hypothetical protein